MINFVTASKIVSLFLSKFLPLLVAYLNLKQKPTGMACQPNFFDKILVLEEILDLAYCLKTASSSSKAGNKTSGTY